MIDQYSKNIDMQDIGLFWQLTIKTIDDLRIVGNENLTIEMYIMQLIHLKSLDNKNEKSIGENVSINNQENLSGKKLEDQNFETNLSNKTKNQLKNTDQIKASPIKNFTEKKETKKMEITNFQDLIEKANLEKEIELKYDLERNVKLVSFTQGKIDISFNEKLNKNFIKNLTEKLLKWTGKRWIISLSKNVEAKSVYEKNLENEIKKIEEFKKSKIATEFEKAFPDAKLLDIESED